MYLSETRNRKIPAGTQSDDYRFESFVLSEIPARKYARALVLSGERYFNLPKNIAKIFFSHNFLKDTDIITKQPKQPDDVVRNILTVCESTEVMDTFQTVEFDLIIISDLLYPEYIGESKLICAQSIVDKLEENGVLLSVHEDRRYALRFPLFITDEYYFDYDNKRYLLEVYTK